MTGDGREEVTTSYASLAATGPTARIATEAEPSAAWRPNGHCGDNASWALFSERYGPMQRHELCGGDMTDFQLANHVFMADRMSLDLIGAQTAAKDRIRWLSVQLAATAEALERIATATPESTNSATIAQFRSWVRAVALTAIAAATGNTALDAKATGE